METFLATFSMYGVSRSILLKHFFLPSTKDFMYTTFPMHLGASYLKKPHSEAFAN